MAELLAGPTATSLAPITNTPLLSGSHVAGYYLGGEQSIASVPCLGIAFIQIQVWNTATGATFGQAKFSGLANAWAESAVFSVVTGNGPCWGGGITAGPIPPATLTGLTPMSLNAAVPIPLLYTTTPGGLILTWKDPAFVLQAATNAAGIYTNVVGAVSPYTNSITGSALFFRLVAN